MKMRRGQKKIGEEFIGLEIYFIKYSTVSHCKSTSLISNKIQSNNDNDKGKSSARCTKFAHVLYIT